MPDRAGQTDGHFEQTGSDDCRCSNGEETQGYEADQEPHGGRGTGFEIPAGLCEELTALAAKRGFESVQEFATHLLSQEATRGEAGNGPSSYSANELELIRRLLHDAEDLE